jgi:hypothetical protein
MASQRYISKEDIANLDQKFDINLAGLNKILDKALDKSQTNLQASGSQPIITPEAQKGGESAQYGAYQNPYVSNLPQTEYTQPGQYYSPTGNQGCNIKDEYN